MRARTGSAPPTVPRRTTGWLLKAAVRPDQFLPHEPEHHAGLAHTIRGTGRHGKRSPFQYGAGLRCWARVRAVHESTFVREHFDARPAQASPPRRAHCCLAGGPHPPSNFYRHLEATLDLSFVRDWARLVCRAGPTRHRSRDLLQAPATGDQGRWTGSQFVPAGDASHRRLFSTVADGPPDHDRGMKTGSVPG